MGAVAAVTAAWAPGLPTKQFTVSHSVLRTPHNWLTGLVPEVRDFFGGDLSTIATDGMLHRSRVVNATPDQGPPVAENRTRQLMNKGPWDRAFHRPASTWSSPGRDPALRLHTAIVTDLVPHHADHPPILVVLANANYYLHAHTPNSK
ncbi:hypothetical protein CBL_06583 [Carabus blaptoides fortunei]